MCIRDDDAKCCWRRCNRAGGEDILARMVIRGPIASISDPMPQYYGDGSLRVCNREMKEDGKFLYDQLMREGLTWKRD